MNKSDFAFTFLTLAQVDRESYMELNLKIGNLTNNQSNRVSDLLYTNNKMKSTMRYVLSAQCNISVFWLLTQKQHMYMLWHLLAHITPETTENIILTSNYMLCCKVKSSPHSSHWQIDESAGARSSPLQNHAVVLCPHPQKSHLPQCLPNADLTSDPTKQHNSCVLHSSSRALENDRNCLLPRLRALKLVLITWR